MSEETDDFLAHFGVMGMKWGKRRGGLKSRLQGAALDRNQRHTAVLTRQVQGKATLGEKVAVAPAKLILGKKRVAKMQAKGLNDLLAQKNRIESGKQNIHDKLQTAMHTSVTELVFSVRDKRV